MLGLPADTFSPIAEAAAAALPSVTVSMPLALALSMWEGVTMLANLTVSTPAGRAIDNEAATPLHLGSLLVQLLAAVDNGGAH